MLRGRFAYWLCAGFWVVACGGGNDNPFVEGPDANTGTAAGSGGRAGAASSTSSTTRGGGGSSGGKAGAGAGGTSAGDSNGGGAGASQMVDADTVDAEDGTTTVDALPDGTGTSDVAIDDVTVDTSDAGNDAVADVSVPSDAGDGSANDAGPSDVSITDASPADADAAAPGDEPQCAGPSDCPAAPSECWTKTCVDGGCGVAPVADGTALASQTAGDCKTRVCNGSGGTRDANNDGDIPSDGNACTLDGCSNGSPTHVVQTGMGCGVNGVCSDSGACVGCNMPEDCPGVDTFCKTRTCASHSCGFSLKTPGTALPDQNQTAGDCTTKVCGSSGDVEDQATPGDLPANSNPCRQAKCTGTTPSTPPLDPGTGCAVSGGHVCDGAGACVECLAPADCGANPAGYPCVVLTCGGNHQCGTTSAPLNTPCGNGASCMSGSEHAADKCNGGGTCVAGADRACAPYVCGGSTCNASCSDNGGCTGAGYVCDTGLSNCTNGPTCTNYCNVIQANCVDTNQQYTSMDLCLHSCAGLPRVASMGTNDIVCRTTHAGFAASDPITHCPHAGPSGAGVCGGTCESFCSLAGTVCTGANQQFLDNDDCLAKCNVYPAPTAFTTGVATGDTFACRMYHLTLATPDALSASTHCPHIAPISSVCHQ